MSIDKQPQSDSPGQIPFHFELIHQSAKSRARVGRIHTPHGIIDTPNFVPVGTNGSIKAVESLIVDSLDVQLMFCNTYHLLVQPGSQTVKRAGGLHRFINRTAPIITDSGGFQVFSLMYGTVHNEIKGKGKKIASNGVLKINEQGVLFRSYRDGSPIMLTPESSIQAQKDLGADIIVSFDELPPYHIDKRALRRSFDRTHRWERRSLDEHLKQPNNQALYAVVHGGVDPELRRESCDILSALPFDGYAIGGSVGKNRQEMLTMLSGLMPRLPDNKPNHLLGIGDVASIAGIVPLGVDTFDSSHPTRCARHGMLLSAQGNIKIKHASNANNFGPVEPGCPCSTCRNYSRAYLHHLFKAHEMAGYTLASIHNLSFMVRLMKAYRQMILEDRI